MQPTPRLLFRVVMLCLFASGAAGLVYEVAWSRYLALFLGHTSYAVVAVLVAFMGGLALGNVAFGRLADRTRRPLAVYAWLEIGIGLYALAFPYWYQLCYDFFVAVGRGMEPGTGASLALKFAFSLLTVLLPTVFMGGTLPVVARLLTRSLSELREKIAGLYFVNSAGAVVGTFVADFWWLPAIGLEATVHAGAALNLMVGVVAFFVSGWIKEGRAEVVTVPAAPVPAPAEESWTFSPTQLRLAVIGIGLSGFVAMLYQIAWTRLLALALGSSTHAFSLMLITFIAGIAVGSYAVYRWRRLGNPLTAFAWIELALAGAVLVSMFFYELLPYWFIRLAELLNRRPAAYPVYEALQGLVCFLVMFLPTVCLGMTLPLVSRVATREAARTGRSVGRVFAINTLGTVLGAAITGLWLMPAVGLARTFALGVAVNALIGLAILLAGPVRRSHGLVWGLPGAVLVAALAAGQHFAGIWPTAFGMGLFRQAFPPTTIAEFRAAARRIETLYHRDGAGATVSVQRQPGTDLLMMRVNGKTDASTGGDMNTQILSGHLPLLLRPASSHVLVVGLGSGITVGAVAQHPNIERIDAVEISPEVIAGARLFAHANHGVLDHPRVRVYREDAKAFLLHTDRRYDVIISEPSNPWMAGVAGVFSREFYETCRSRLAPDGVILQWMQLYEFSDGGLDIVLATFSRVFPFVSVWQSLRGDLFLVGTVNPLPVNLTALAARMAEPSVRADLARVGLDNTPLLLSQEMISFGNGALVAPFETRAHSDYYPVLEYRAQRDFFVRGRAERIRKLDETFSRRPDTLLGQWLRQHPLTTEDLAAFAAFYLDEGRSLDAFLTLLKRWQREQPDNPTPWELAARLDYLAPSAELEVLRLAPRRELMFARAERDPTLLRQYGRALMFSYLEQVSVFNLPPTDELMEVLLRLIRHDPDNQRTYQAWLAQLAWDREDDEQCRQWAELAFAPDPPRGQAKFALDPHAPLRAAARLADVYLRRGAPARAVRFCESVIAAGHNTEETRFHALPFELTLRRAQAALAEASTAPGNPSR
ncbi:MAG: fused MFS/spermidine synthase [Verrucomicrobia bacterium]|nr:fused MFS/spermidine synthase [Verrucomicrobiota bacterium]